MRLIFFTNENKLKITFLLSIINFITKIIKQIIKTNKLNFIL